MEQPPSRTPAWKIILIGLYVFALVAFVIYVVQLLTYPFDWDFAEGQHLYAGMRLLHGESLYQYGDRTNWFIVYGPVFPLFLSALLHLVPPSLLIGRVLDLVAVGIMSGLISHVIFRETRSKFYAFIGAAMLLAPKMIAGYWILNRPDTLAVLFSFLSMYATYRYAYLTRRRWLIAALFLALLAAYTKQNYAVMAVAIILMLILWHKRREAFWFTIVYGALGLSIFFIIQIATKGAFAFNTVGAFVQQLNRNSLYLGSVLLGVFLVYFFASLAIVVGKWKQLLALRQRPFFIFVLYVLVSVVAITLSAYTLDGGGTYYYAGALPAIIIVSMYLLAQVTTRGTFQNVIRGAFVAQAMVQIFFGGFYVRSLTGLFPAPPAAARQSMRALDRLIAKTPGDVLIQDLPALQIRHNKEVWANFVVFATRVGAGGVNTDLIGHKIRQQEFALIIRDARKISLFSGLPFIAKPMAQYYQFVKEIPLVMYSPPYDGYRINFSIFMPKRNDMSGDVLIE